MMTSPYLYTRKCPRGHPVESDATRCPLCAQENREQERKDDLLLEQLDRLAKRGKIKKELLIGRD